MKFNYPLRSFIIQVVGLLLIWCMAMFSIFQIRSLSLNTLNMPSSQIDYRLIIYQPKEEFHIYLSTMYKNMHNLPIEYWKKQQMHQENNLKDHCAIFPNPLTMEFHKTYWQFIKPSDASVRIFSAYLDTRKNNPDVATVRVLAMLARKSSIKSIYCQLWTEEQREPIIVNSQYLTNLYFNENAEGLPSLINCVLPPEHKHVIPVAVSLVENPCDHSVNVLKVIYNKYVSKKDFGVCVKGLDLPHLDFSDKLIEWIELLTILGAKSVFFYDVDLHPNVRKILKHYTNERKVQLTEIEVAEGSHDLMVMQKEIIPYTDCFYKNMYQFERILLLDIDEILLPLKTSTWQALASSLNTETAYHTVKSVYFIDKLVNKSDSANLSILQNIYRKNATDTSVKTLFNTEKMLTVHNDLPVGCLNECSYHNIHIDEAYLQHYHKNCTAESKKNCVDFPPDNSLIIDESVRKFNSTLTEKVFSTRKYLGLPINGTLIVD